MDVLVLVFRRLKKKSDAFGRVECAVAHGSAQRLRKEMNEWRRLPKTGRESAKSRSLEPVCATKGEKDPNKREGRFVVKTEEVSPIAAVEVLVVVPPDTLPTPI
jgi:hypothetical protein